MMDRSPAQMTPDEIVDEINTLHKDLTVRFSRVQHLAQGLYHRVRRATPDDNTSVYITYAHAWMRFAGMGNQAVLRTVSASKVLRRLTPVTEATPPTSEAKRKVASKAQATSPVEDLITMYGEDSTTEASNDADPVTADA